MLMSEDSSDEFTENWTDWIDIRVDQLETRYEESHVTDFDRAKLEQLHKQLLQLIGERNLFLLSAYTDRLIALYNRDTEWFYKKGWQDAMHILQDTPEKWHNKEMR